MSSLNKAISKYRDVDDGGSHYSSAKCSSESSAGASKSSIKHSRTLHSPPNAKNVIELEGPLHEDIRTHLTEVVQAGTRALKIPE